MKGCYVISEWIDKGTPEAPDQIPLVADEYPCYCEDVTSQFVLLREGGPNPNLAVFKVVEIRTPKHDGRIEAIKKDARFCVLEEWEIPINDALPVPVQTVSDKNVKAWLRAREVKAVVANLVKGEHRVNLARKLFKDFERT